MLDSVIRDWLEPPPLTFPWEPPAESSGSWYLHGRLLFLIRIELKWNVLTNHHLQFFHDFAHNNSQERGWSIKWGGATQAQPTTGHDFTKKL
jgi:hypothetical protein